MPLPDGLPTDQNFLALDPEDSDTASAGVVIIQVPHEATSTFGEGSAFGPARIVAASQEVELFDAALGFEPFRACGGIATLPPLNLGECDGAAVAERLRLEARRWLGLGRFTITIGGEHSSIVGAVQASCETFSDLTVLQLDAHSDLRPDFEGTPWNHACAVARILDFHDSVVQAGIRSQAPEEREISESLGLPVFYAHDIHDREADGIDWIGDLVAALRPNVHITFDCDAFDPAVIPATGTPEPNGLTWRQVDRLLDRVCRERNLVSFDVSELAPIPGLHHPEFTVAKMIYRWIGRRFQPLG
jgi:agmatinase